MTIEVLLRHQLGGFRLDVEFRVERPGVTALFGPSGAGKTTIVNAVAGLLRPQKGRVVIGGRVMLDTQAGIFVPPRRRGIGYVFQDARLFPHMSVADNLRFGWRRASAPANADEFAHMIDLLGLESLLTRRPAGLSGGERNRVALGRALLSSPSLLLLDEPLAALDAARKAEIFPYLERLRDVVPMIYVTHSTEEVSRLADQVIVLRNGRLAAQGTVFDLLSNLEFTALTGAPAYGAVIPARVIEHRAADGLTILSFEGGEIVISCIDRPIGSELRVHLRAEDVMLSRDRPGAISANNVLQTTVADVRVAGDGHADVLLSCGAVKFVARITRASLARLAIEPGVALFAIIKSVTVDPQLGPAPQ